LRVAFAKTAVCPWTWRFASRKRAPSGDRTHDHTLTKRMLCQLSYRGKCSTARARCARVAILGKLAALTHTHTHTHTHAHRRTHTHIHTHTHSHTDTQTHRHTNAHVRWRRVLIVRVRNEQKMTTPGVEPGLSRPQRDVLTTRRCGLLPKRQTQRSSTGIARIMKRMR
jgi:hypothetical protein